MKRSRFASLALATLIALLSIVPARQPITAQTPSDYSASGFGYYKPFDQPTCDSFVSFGFPANYFIRTDCIGISFSVMQGTRPVAGDGWTVTAEFFEPGEQTPFATRDAADYSEGQWRTSFRPDLDWPAGELVVRVKVNGTAASGEGRFYMNVLGATLNPAATSYTPGEAVTVSGNLHELNSVAINQTQRTGVPGRFQLRLRLPDGVLRGPYPSTTTYYQAELDGDFGPIELPGAATDGLTIGPETNFQVVLSLEAVEASYSDPLTGAWAAELAGTTPLTFKKVPTSLLLENKFVSSVGWVKPGESYPFRVLVKNLMEQDATNVQVTIPAPDGTTFTRVRPLSGVGTASIAKGSITWTIASLPASSAGTIATLVVEARADNLAQDPEIVWKDLSSTATLTYSGYAGQLSAESHGPKVIPPAGGFETARYGEKPFPIVPVDYSDRKHEPGHNGDVLANVVNNPHRPGSTFNLYQEMSFGQLFPIGAVPSAGIATADFEEVSAEDFSKPDPANADPSDPGSCRGTTMAQLPAAFGTPAYPERIRDGWYQLPGDTEYYGGDYPAFTLGVGSKIDGACGNISKSVYDAAVIADPEIDYNQFDSDKDGVVDFFMMVFVGEGGNGVSQTSAPPYDNIWPHSSSLEFAYQDANGLAGYISDDQLTDLEGTPQCWTSAAYATFADCAAYGGSGLDALPAYVRVGPYNVNPESAIEAASVIAHEYGHHLGLPDFYNTSWEAYNDWNLMAADYSQHMTIFSKQELGWVVPRFLQPGETLEVSDWEEIKNDTGEIVWQRPDGTSYTLSAANGHQNIHNGEAYALKLPPRELIDKKLVEQQASAPYLWYSGRGNNFGCAPRAGHNLDIVLDELATLSETTTISVTFKSSWDIEWDWDFGFTMVTTDGRNYTALPSEQGYTSQNVFNPNDVACFETFNNGLTGQSGTYQKGTSATERLNPSYGDGAPFLLDEYDLSAYAGQENVVLRFSYFTDPGFDRPGWFIDDFTVWAGGKVIYSSDFTKEEPLRFFPGGCGDEGMRVAVSCTDGWSRIKADAGSTRDHAYYLELRDRSGFDFNGRGQSNRGTISWQPGVLIEYTDEVRGYGNSGSSMPPNQHYLDSNPKRGIDCGDGITAQPQCGDAAFTSATGDNRFQDKNWIDNFKDKSSKEGYWHFTYNCLTLDVTSMSGHIANSEALPSDLTANATLQAGPGCSTFSYGYDPASNNKPVAIAQARPLTVREGQPVQFDGSASFDDITPVDALIYKWDFDGNGSYEGTGRTLRHTYSQPGSYTATLQVTDAGGLFSTDSVTITVEGRCPLRGCKTYGPLLMASD